MARYLILKIKSCLSSWCLSPLPVEQAARLGSLLCSWLCGDRGQQGATEKQHDRKSRENYESLDQ